VVALAPGPADGLLHAVGQAETGLTTPCYLAASPAGGFVIVANFRRVPEDRGSAGGVSVLRLDEVGRPTHRTEVATVEGSGPHPTRQTASHPHCVRFSADHRRVWTADLGNDQLRPYRLTNAGTLALDATGVVDLPAGCGPRHLAVDLAGRMIYVVTEMGNTVIACRTRPDAAPEIIQEMSLLAGEGGDRSAEGAAADIVLHPSDRWLYASHRGLDTVAMLAIAPEGRCAQPVHVPAGGGSPRTLVMDPSSRWILAITQDPGAVTSFAIDPGTGRLTPAGTLPIPAAICACFVRVA
jgi:6-phosphogluconolactonase